MINNYCSLRIRFIPNLKKEIGVFVALEEAFGSFIHMK